MRTFLNMLQVARTRSVASWRPSALHARASALSLGSERGDSLIEVLISAVIVALIVVGTFSGLDSTNRATALQRARSQASALAEQNEEQLSGRPVKQLSEISETHEALLREVRENGTVYKIVSTAQYISNTTATASCSSTTPSADYIQTTSKVTWPSMGTTKPVVETSLVSPPAGSALIVQVTGASGEAVQEMSASTTKGPTSISAPTSSNGCAILAVLPGEYALNVTRTGYVDQNGFVNSSEDPFYNASFYVVAESSAKKSFEFASAGELAVKFESPVAKTKVSGETFLALNTGISSPSYKVFGEVGKSAATVESPKKLFPFTSPYTVYAGSCPADAPTVNGQSSNPTLTVPAGGRAEGTVPLPPVSSITVKDGTASGSPGSLLSGAAGTITDTGCAAEGITVKRAFTTNSEGKMPYPGLPYGKYSMCVTATISGQARKSTVTVLNNSPSGPASQVIYLGAGALESGC
jgi:Tfp pilus assembly protein PilV